MTTSDKPEQGTLTTQREFSVDTATFEGCLASLPKITIRGEQYGTLSRFLIIAPNLWGTGIDMELGYADVLPIGNKLRVCFYTTRESDDTPGCAHPGDDELFQGIVDAVIERTAEHEMAGADGTENIGKSVTAKRGMMPWRQKRAELFKQLKDAHPEWTQSKVAAEAIEETYKRLENAHPEWDADEVARSAAEELRGSVTSETVRNDYRVMGWDWDRADRIR